MKKKVTQQDKMYYLGLDIGTDSVGWAVTDVNYKLLRVNNKSLWGVRLFEEAHQANVRRLQRETRRRLERRKRRIDLLQQIFAPVINAKDPNFFARLEDSNLYGGDKREHSKFSLFNDSEFTDKEFYTLYKTVYHLRSALLSEENPDPRLVYLALHHIVKYRGHFLIEGDINAVDDISQPIEAIKRYLAEKDEIDCFDMSKTDQFRELLIKKAGKTARANSYAECFSVKKENKKFAAILKLIAGCRVNIKDLSVDCDDDKLKIDFESDWENQESTLRETLQDDYVLVENAKLLYDYSQYKAILGNHKYLSQGMVEKFEKHKSDLNALKYVLRKYFPREQYNKMFRNALEKNVTNYTAYSGRVLFGKKHGKKIILEVKSDSRDYDEFVKYVKKVLESSKSAMQDEVTKRILTDIEKKEFMPKQVSKNNSTLPYQLNLVELEAILDNAVKYPEYSFLNEVDENGLSIRAKLCSLLTFRMPYYVGPTNNHTDKYWIVRSDDGQILPWNYEQKIDLEQTERNFIERMTNKCPYIDGEKVLPKCSLLYEEFVFLNIINKIKINGEPINVSLKQKLSEYYAETGKNKLSKKFIREWLVAENQIENGDCLRIEGFDDGATVHRRTYYQFIKIMGSASAVIDHAKDIEEIIRYATIAGTEKGNLEKWLAKHFTYLSLEQIKQIKGLTCKGWGKCSQKFLTMKIGTDLITGEVHSFSVMDALRATTLNFMEIWHDERWGFTEAFESERNQSSKDISYELVENLYCSPAVKKQIWQALSVVKELRDILGCAPTKIFVEVARGSDPKQDKLNEKKRTTSRYEQLSKTFDKLREQNDVLFNEELYKEFAKVGERKEKLQNKKLYLYFMQNGRDVYTGERINYNDFNSYDIDHIYPRSKVKDDSIHNNLVLTYRPLNNAKKDVYPISESIRTNPQIIALWKALRQQGLMSEEKYKRLTRTTELRDDELAEFINRQLVETRQSTKEVIGVLKRVFYDSKCEIVWSKAGNVSDFRALPKRIGEVSVPRFVKCRELNDLHHAKDAYLNIVVSNTYNVRYGHNAKYWLEKHPTERLVSSAKLFDHDVKTQKVTAWIAGDNGTMAQVEKTMRSNAVLFTRESQIRKGQLFDLTLYGKGRKELVPLKSTGNTNIKFSKMSDTSKYGGYTSEKCAYTMLVKIAKKQGAEYKFVSVPKRFAIELTDDVRRIDYCALQRNLLVKSIVVPKIKMQTLFEINGVLLSLAGLGVLDDRIVWNLAQQLKVDSDTETYFKRVVNVAQKNLKLKNEEKYCANELNDGVGKEQNMILYNELVKAIEKIGINGISVFKKFVEELTMSETLDKFTNLSLTEQCEALVSIQKSLKCNAEISEVKQLGIRCGRIRVSSTYHNLANMFIVHRSVTGVFEQKIPLTDFDK